MKTGTPKQPAMSHPQNHENRTKQKAEGLKPTEPGLKPRRINETAAIKTVQ